MSDQAKLVKPLLETRGLSRAFGSGKRVVRAVQDVDLAVHPGEVLGLVGESGSGKSTIGRLVLRLIDPSAGDIVFEGESIAHAPERKLKSFRRKAQMVFQDPFASLNPRLDVEAIIGEALDAHGLHQGARRRARIGDLLEMVGLPAAAMKRYPHEFSGGQRQRIGIARALAVEPKLIVADEPVSALDVSVQAQVLNLMQELRHRLGLAMILISHDLDVVELMSDRIAVLYLGRIMEQGPADAIVANPRHPYTRALIAASPKADPDAARAPVALAGELPSPLAPPSGCVFRTRCPHARAVCADEIPVLRGEGAHRFACHFDLAPRASDDGAPGMSEPKG